MSSNTSSFRATQWDPVLILSQIVCLQAIWYISISTIVYIFSKLSGTDLTLDAILNFREIRADNAQGMVLGLAWLLNSVVGVYLLLKIVSRARLVLDFSLTLLLYHVLMTTLYSDHVPSSFLWWALNGTTCGIMIFGGEYVCMQLEMEPIVLGGNNNNNTGTNGNNSSQSVSGSNQGGISGSSGHGGDEESAGLLMESMDSSGADLSSSAVRAMMPQKARSSEDATAVRGSYSPSVRSSIMGGQNLGRQRTSDRYEMVPVGDPDTRK
ncbi:protein SYS1 [Entomortierella parvispora]|uniref:Protein SYS1 n=1 Tax=Entomortierella parvispora TaxID=205924 RepID=A0A9P3H2Z4_9FUNG|nr:protein SYS1 [Entomortierella parvispora]